MLNDKDLIDRIVEAAEIDSNDIVFEIGSGNGILTRELCKRAKRVISCEIDRDMYNIAKSMEYDNLELYNTDGFRYGLSINFDKFVANIPYSRSKDTIELLAKKEFKLAVIMLQREFATKLLMSDRAISAIARYCFDIEHICYVHRSAFKPIPKVDSTIIRLRKKHALTNDEIKAIRLLYSFKGRKVKHASRVLALSIDESLTDKRVEMLTPEEIVSIIR